MHSGQRLRVTTSRSSLFWRIGYLLALLGAGLAIGMIPQGAVQAAPITGSPFTTAGEHSFVVPPGVLSLDVVLTGGAGGPGGKACSCQNGGPDGAPGAKGAQVTARIDVTPGQTIYVEVGGNGAKGADGPPTLATCHYPGSEPGGAGGTNGGGTGGTGINCLGGGGGGGGFSALRVCPLSGAGCPANPWLVVAGGGGGGSAAGVGSGGSGGDNGTSDGADGQTAGYGGGGGATQASAGAGGTEAGGYTAGTAGSGTRGGTGGNFAGGGGGGGYFGGGGGGWGGGGGGGSSYGPASATYATATGAPSVTVEITVFPQYIDFPQPTAVTYGAVPFTISATAKREDNDSATNLTVGFASQTTTVCSVGSSTITAGVSQATVTILTAGDCTIQATQAGDTTRAPATAVPRTITINKKGLVVTAQGKTREYGEDNPTFTANITGFAYSQTLATSDVTGSPALTTTATKTSPISGSPYTIAAALGTLTSTNYAFTFVDGELVVTRAPLTVTANNVTRQYGLPNPSFGITLTGFKNNEDATSAGVTGSADFSTTATPTSPPGPYAVVPTLGTLSAANYSFGPFVNSTLTIVKADTQLNPVRGDVTYGDTLGSIRATLRRTDNGSPIASMTIGFTLNGAAVCGGSSGRTCPTTNAQGVAELTGITFQAGMAAGNYANRICATYAGTGDYESAGPTCGPLVVARRVLTVKASDRTVGLKQPNPSTTPPVGCAVGVTGPSACWLELVSGSGFVNGDSWSALNFSLLRFQYSRNPASTNASEQVGSTYRITALGAISANYELRILQGILTVK